ncbi:MAG: Zn-ribbon-containing protein [Defluviitaleaceae bacterium]|nr:Zn-ribbon-containing protein [Defluviitaleaceae bacterium]
MYTFEIRFFPKTFDEPFIDEFDNHMHSFMSCLYKNGQTLGKFENKVKLDDHYACRIATYEMDSLDEKYFNKYCKERITKISEMSVKEPVFHFVGKNYNVRAGCACESPSHYILLHSLDGESPVVCGDCLEGVPLYKLPKIQYASSGEEHDNILWWEWKYEGYQLQFIGWHGKEERRCHKMMSNPKSPLSKEGRRICKQMEKLTKKPFYYFLYNWYKDNKKTCPKCKKPWVNKDWDNKNKKIRYEYVCKKCRLVSNDMMTP